MYGTKMTTSGYGFIVRKEAVYHGWLEDHQGEQGVPSEAELQRLRKETVKAIEAVDEEDYRTVVRDSRPPASPSPPARARHDATRRDATTRAGGTAAAVLSSWSPGGGA